MPLVNKVYNAFYLRARLFKRFGYRLWKSFIVSKADPLIGNLQYESRESFLSAPAAIILSTFTQLSDFLILSRLFQEKQLTFISPRTLPKDRIVNWLKAVNHILYFEGEQLDFSFFKKLLTILRDFNRSIVISPEAAEKYAEHILIDHVIVVRIAMMANVPIIPVVLRWRKPFGRVNGRLTKCDVWIGKSIYISPRAAEFRDIFFKRRGARKFRDLPDEDLKEIGNRIFNKLKSLGQPNGPDL